MHLLNMARKPYRVELIYAKGRRPQYYLAKDIWFKGKKDKVRTYIGTEQPTIDEVELARKFAFNLEIKAAKKIGKISEEKFTINYLTKEKIGELEELKYLYKKFNDLLTKNETSVYEQKFELQYVQGTTSIEGNTLSLDQVRNLFVHKIVPQNKTLREINEVQNFVNVKKFRDTYNGKIDLDFVRTVHSLIMQNIDNESAGVFRRTDDIGIVGCDIRISPSIEIEENLSKIIDCYYNNLKKGYHPFEEAIMFHYCFEIIHPFSDGNGRVGREILNYMLMKNRYPKLLFLGEGRVEYLNALKFGNEEKYSKMVTSFSDIVLSQRSKIVLENIKKLTETLPQKRQARLTEFFST